MKSLINVILFFAAYSAFSQSAKMTVGQAVAEALKNNLNVKASIAELESKKELKKTSFDLPKTDVTILYGQNNSYPKNDNNILISQSIPVSVFGSLGNLNREVFALSELKKKVTENEIAYQVKQTYYQLAYAYARQEILIRQDSIFGSVLRTASFKYKNGETNLLDFTTAEAQRSESRIQLLRAEADFADLQIRLRILINAPASSEFIPDMTRLSIEIQGDTVGMFQQNPSLSYIRQQIDVKEAEKKLLKSKMAPDLLVGFYSQTFIEGPLNNTGELASSTDRFTGIQLGLSLPLWFVPHHARIKAASWEKKVAEANVELQHNALQADLQRALRQMNNHKLNLEYYTTTALPNADLILKQSDVAFREGEIQYAEFLSGLKTSMTIQEGYLKSLNDYNQSIIYIEYLTGKK
jgi:cobalt-zinc-cadmium resistance protein CzcA